LITTEAESTKFLSQFNRPVETSSTQESRPLRAGTDLGVRLAAILPHRVAAHLDTVSVVNQPVEDTIGHRGIANLFVPPGHRQL
jgi:hypothetical protein